MSDLHQSGPVTALPRLVARSVEDLEAEIIALTPKFPVSLVIPMLPAEMDRPASAASCRSCAASATSTRWSSRSTRRTWTTTSARWIAFQYQGNLVIVWNESPAVQRFFDGLTRAGLSVGSPGKGRACWLAMGYLLAEENVDYMAFLDADIVNFNREMLARLVLPALDPIVDFDFVKASCAFLEPAARAGHPALPVTSRGIYAPDWG